MRWYTPNTSSAVSICFSTCSFHRVNAFVSSIILAKAISPSVCDRQTIAESVNGCLMTNGENFVSSIFMCRNTLAVSLIPLKSVIFRIFSPYHNATFLSFLICSTKASNPPASSAYFVKTHSTISLENPSSS